jgi:hypothetical protein
MRGATSVRALAMSYSALLVVLSGFQSANAGPPFQTDDPVPVALGHYELYCFDGHAALFSLPAAPAARGKAELISVPLST